MSGSLFDRIRAWGLWLLPHHALSALMRGLTRWRAGRFKNALIRRFISLYEVDMSQAATDRIDSFPHFNAFFTRALKPDARPLPDDPESMVSPCDGTVSQCGSVEKGNIFQAKGHHFDVNRLLGDDPLAAEFFSGDFATIYLSPRDYHRVHMPLDGNLRSQVHVPGRLFSVAPWTVRAVPGLFARNERLACLFDGPAGPWALVMVGAIFVSSMSTVWAGTITPPRAKRAHRIAYDSERPGVVLQRGEEMGRFNMGSTVILLTPSGMLREGFDLRPEQGLRMGEAIGVLAKG